MGYNLNSGYGKAAADALHNIAGGTGKVFIVSASGVAGRQIYQDIFGGDPDGIVRYHATVDAAINATTANRGDVILVAPGHTETIAAASGVDQDVAGVSVIGLGVGADRPTFTFSDTAATWTTAAASGVLKNIIVVPSVDSVVSPIVVSAADCVIDIESRDASAAVEFVRTILTTADADNLTIKLKHQGFTGGNAGVNAIRLVGGTNTRIDIDYFGLASTAVVEFHTTAVIDCNVEGYMYNSGTTDYSKDVVDTATGSTWYAEIHDGGAGAMVSGGSGNALAAGDLSAIATGVATIQAQQAGTAGITTWPAAAAPANGVSMAEAVRWIADAQSGTAGITTWAAGAAPANGVSMAEGLRYTAESHTVPTADSADNSVMSDVIGNKTDTTGGDSIYANIASLSADHTVPAQNAADNNTFAEVIGNKTDTGAQAANATTSTIAYAKGTIAALTGPGGIGAWSAAAAPANGVSISEAIRAIYDRQLGDGTDAGTNSVLGIRVLRTPADVFDGTTTSLFTVAGGNVLITHVQGLVGAAAIDAGASNTKLQANPTTGTTTDMCANLDINAHEAGTLYSITGVASDALVSGSSGSVQGMGVKGVVVAAGTIDLVSAADVGTGGATGEFTVFYIPLDNGATVTST